jgi:hypothetical protein
VRSVGRGGGGGVGVYRGPEIVVIETEGKNSVDSGGYRWPDEVVLHGEAREMREWSKGYGLGDEGEKRRREEGRRKRFECEMGLEKI